jgi:transposase
MNILEISRRTGLSRNTVRKYITVSVVEPKYPARTVTNKLDAFAPMLGSWPKNVWLWTLVLTGQ